MKVIGQQSSNGWLLSVLSFCSEQYGWSIEYTTEDVSLTLLMLLMRQKTFVDSDGKSGFTLFEQEKLDNLSNMSWDELVRQNR